jgi:1,4-dihydroxy-6-naphthoate synthase
MKDKLTIGFSPCPNDTFIFDSMVNGNIDVQNIEFIPYLNDVEDLNQKALEGILDITKLSYHAWLHVSDKYQLLTAGSALGRGCGPLLISKKQFHLADIHQLKIAIPGKYTTANLLFSIAFPDAKNKKEIIFSDIEMAVLSGEVDAGVIIHENRFTYEQKGLFKLIDLGKYWEDNFNQLIPLGGIAIKRNFPNETKSFINELIKKSIEDSFQNKKLSKYVITHAQEMDEMVMQQHIDLYVNEYTKDLGNEGKSAVEFMCNKAKELNLIPNEIVHPIFIS